SNAHTALGSVRSAQRRLGQKAPPPEGLRRFSVLALLLLGHSPTAGDAPSSRLARTENRRNKRGRIYETGYLGASTVACIALVFASANSFAQVATSIGPFGYQNQLYNPAAGPIPGLTLSPQPKGVAIFGGNLGAFGQPAT